MIAYNSNDITIEQLFERIKELEAENTSKDAELAAYRKQVDFIYSILAVDKTILKTTDKTAALILARQFENKRTDETGYHTISLRESSQLAGIGYTTFQRSTQRLADIGAISKRLTNFEHDGPNGTSTWTSEVAIKPEPVFSFPRLYSADDNPITWGGKRITRCTNPKCNGVNIWKTTEVTCEDCGAILEFERIEVNRDMPDSGIFQVEKSIGDENVVESSLALDDPPVQLDALYTQREEVVQVEKSGASENVDTVCVSPLALPHIFQVEKSWEERLSNFAQIPLAMQQEKRWVVWRYVQKEGKKKPSKVPYIADLHARDSVKAKSNDPSTWRSFDDALTLFFNSHEQGWKVPFDGIMFASGDGWIFTDQDVDKETGQLDNAAYERLIPTYTEWSVNGGIHQIGKGVIPQKRHLKDIEIYDQTQFVAITGDRWETMPETVEACQEELTTLYESVVPVQPSPKKNREAGTHTRVHTLSKYRSDEQILEMAMSNEKTGARFTQLWQGDTTAYAGDESRADLALCSSLAYWTECDVEAMDRLFRKSGRYREKLNQRARAGETYGEGTIRIAIEGM